jgi:hypothetical protein
MFHVGGLVLVGGSRGCSGASGGSWFSIWWRWLVQSLVLLFSVGGLFTGVRCARGDVLTVGGWAFGLVCLSSVLLFSVRFFLDHIALCGLLVGVALCGFLGGVALWVFVSGVALCGFVGGVALCGFVGAVVLWVFVDGVALCGFVGGVALCGFVGMVLAVCRLLGRCRCC